MNTFLSGNSIVEAVQRSLRETKKVDFAVAYWGDGATERLELEKAKRLPVRIICDLESLNCNPNELQKLLNLGFKLKAQDGLHAKVYITTSGVIIGSANASNNGLNQEGAEIDFQREAAVECTDATIMENASEWFDKHWDEASKIDKKRLDRIRPIWLAKRKSGLLSLLVHNPLTFAKIPIRLVVFEDLGDDAQYTQIWNDVKRNYSKEQIDRHGYNLGNYPIYVDPTRRWNIKSGEFVVNYWIRRKSWSLTTDGGVWCVRETVPGPNGERVILADQVTTVYGFNFFNSDYRILKSCVQDHLKNNSSRDFKNHILLDVQLGELPKKQRDIFKRLVDAIDKPAKRRPASTSRNRPSK